MSALNCTLLQSKFACPCSKHGKMNTTTMIKLWIDIGLPPRSGYTVPHYQTTPFVKLLFTVFRLKGKVIVMQLLIPMKFYFKAQHIF